MYYQARANSSRIDYDSHLIFIQVYEYHHFHAHKLVFGMEAFNCQHQNISFSKRDRARGITHTYKIKKMEKTITKLDIYLLNDI